MKKSSLVSLLRRIEADQEVKKMRLRALKTVRSVIGRAYWQKEARRDA